MPCRSCCTSTSQFGLPPQGRLFDPSLAYVTSPFFSARTLAIVRLVVAVYIFVTLVVHIVLDGVTYHHAQQWFSYFTHLCFVGQCAYFSAAGTQTWIYAKKGEYKLRRWPTVLQFLHVLLTATVVTFPFLVTAVFWALLSSPSTFDSSFSTWANISMHALNSVFVLFEILLTNLPPAPWGHLPICVLFLAGYLGIAYITFATQRFYTYSFLNPSKKGAYLAVYIIGIAVGECIVYAIVYGIVFLRVKLTRHYKAVESSDKDEYKESFSEWQQMSRPSV